MNRMGKGTKKDKRHTKVQRERKANQNDAERLRGFRENKTIDRIKV